MSEQTMRGVFPILITPFDEQARIDETSLMHAGASVAAWASRIGKTEPIVDNTLSVMRNQHV